MVLLFQEKWLSGKEDFNMRNKATDLEVAKKFMQIQLRAVKKNLEFDMSLARVRTLMNTQRCFFTNVIMTRGYGSDENQLSFDRIDNSKGYTDANVVACTTRINLLKSNLSIEDIEFMYKGIQKHKK